jgi:hypothetical protein
MALLSGARVAWTYTADDGHTYRVAAQAAMTAQGVLGGVAAAGTLPEKPSGIRMRRVTVSNGVLSRVISCYSPTAPICTAGTSVNANRAGDSHAFTSNGGFIPEGGPRRNVTKK